MMVKEEIQQNADELRNPPWVREELLLALELYLKNRSSPPGKTSEAVGALSAELNRLQARLGNTGSASFRNPSGVYLKLMNFRGRDPKYTSQGKVGMRHGNKLEPEIWDEFFGNEKELSRVCLAIREAMKEFTDDLSVEENSYAEASEGKLLTRLHFRRERSAMLVSKKKSWALKKFGSLVCEACGFDFEKVYGARGRGFSECHHTKPLHELGEDHKTTTDDLAILCSNCHRMIHAKRPWLTVDTVKTLLQRRL